MIRISSQSMTQLVRPEIPVDLTIERLVSLLKQKNVEKRDKAAQQLAEHISGRAVEMPQEAFTKLLDQVSTTFQTIADSGDSNERVGVLTTIHRLLDMDVEAKSVMIVKFANVVRSSIRKSQDLQTNTAATKVLGQMARMESSLTNEYFDYQIGKAIEYLSVDKTETRRHVAVNILNVLAENAPTLFFMAIMNANSSVKLILDAIKDPKSSVRESTALALRSILKLFQSRETAQAELYSIVSKEAFSTLRSSASTDFMRHGALLILREILIVERDTVVRTGNLNSWNEKAKFLDFGEFARTIFTTKDSKDKSLKRVVISMVPLLAQIDCVSFVDYIEAAVALLITALKKETDKSLVFSSLGELISASGGNLRSHRNVIGKTLLNFLQKKGTQPGVNEAVTCVGKLCMSVRDDKLTVELVRVIIVRPLTKELVETLDTVRKMVPSLVNMIENELMNKLSTVLAGKDFAQFKLIPTIPSSYNMDTFEPQMLAFSLHVLHTFGFTIHDLTHFTHKCILQFLDHDSAEVRMEAAITCTKLIGREDRPIPVEEIYADIIDDVVEKLLTLAISDPAPSIRVTVLQNLTSRFDEHLAQPENLRSLFTTLNDESFQVKKIAIALIGRLTVLNPAYVMPSLRRTLIQLLMSLQYSEDSLQRERSSILLSKMLQSARTLTLPYLTTIIKTLRVLLSDSSQSVVARVLEALGELAAVGGSEMMQYMKDLMPLMIQSLQDHGSVQKRLMTLRTMGKLIQSTGYVIEPYKQFPTILGVLLQSLEVDNDEVKMEVIIVLGIMGAIDPYDQAMIVQGDVADDEVDINSSTYVSPDNYYTRVVFSALISILKKPALSTHHPNVVQAIMYIFKSIGTKCVPFLPMIIEPYLGLIETSESNVRDFLFQELGLMISIVEIHIQPYLEKILAVTYKYWRVGLAKITEGQASQMLTHLISLLRMISKAMSDKIKVFLPEMVPKMLAVLSRDRTESMEATLKTLDAIIYLGANLESYLYIVLPVVVRLFDGRGTIGEIVAIKAIKAIDQLCTRMRFNDYASGVIHPLSRVIEDGTADMSEEAMNTLCSLIKQLGPDFTVFIGLINKVMARRGISHAIFQEEVNRLLKSPYYESIHADDEVSIAYAYDTGQRRADSNADRKSKPIKFKVQQSQLAKAWQAKDKHLQADWKMWMSKLTHELLRQSPSPSLRSCSALAQIFPPIERELFNVAFVSCWPELGEAFQADLIQNLEYLLSSATLPTEILQMILNLAEFMEHEDKMLPIGIDTLGQLAEKCKAYAKALHYKELQFRSDPRGAIEDLISINNKLQLFESAEGILTISKNFEGFQVQEGWREELERWDDALESYKKRIEEDPSQIDSTKGMLRCLNALGEWSSLLDYCESSLHDKDDDFKEAVSTLAAEAAWSLGRWDKMTKYTEQIPPKSLDGAMLRAVLSVRSREYEGARNYISSVRDILMDDIVATVGESYNRAYGQIVTVQQLTELEEVIDYMETSSESKKKLIRLTWQRRLKGVSRNVDVWLRMLKVRALVLSPMDDKKMWLKFSKLCLSSDRLELSRKTVRTLDSYRPGTKSSGGVFDFPEEYPSDSSLNLTYPDVTFAVIKHKWIAGEKESAIQSLTGLVQTIGVNVATDSPQEPSTNSSTENLTGKKVRERAISDVSSIVSSGEGVVIADLGEVMDLGELLSRCHLRLGDWLLEESGDEAITNIDSSNEILNHYEKAASYNKDSYKAWHKWAVLNFDIVSQLDSDGVQRKKLGGGSVGTSGSAVGGSSVNGGSSAGSESALASGSQLTGIAAGASSGGGGYSGSSASAESPATAPVEGESSDRSPKEGTQDTTDDQWQYLENYIIPAIRAFFRSIALGRGNSIQDTLRLISLWFKYGELYEVEKAMSEGFATISIDTWLEVIPQLIARIHMQSLKIRKQLITLLMDIGKAHPQALVYPLTVASKSDDILRHQAALAIIENMKQHSPKLVTQAKVLSDELVRVSVLWPEIWHQKLEEASREFFGFKRPENMIAILLPLHDLMEAGASTKSEQAFLQTNQSELVVARDRCLRFQKNNSLAELNQAWDSYYNVFRKINKYLPTMNVLELSFVSPVLKDLHDLDLVVPGTYAAGSGKGVSIKEIHGSLAVIKTKQRPRKLSILGSDGVEYKYLLKGSEDMRQDERVMQFFGLVNTLLSNHTETSRRRLNIQRSHVMPLSTESGLLGWYSKSDTLNLLVKMYRESRKMPVNNEHKMIQQRAPNYDQLTLIQKLEVFQNVLKRTSADDLAKILWLKSNDSEIWLERRTNYTGSLAVMSMVGYILGLGDRHPSNLMMNRSTGKIIHIDFGDCFEVAMQREKFPEKIPFRLTRMLISAMEACGIEGIFKHTCVRVMGVLRKNRDSLLAVLEAFVYDPLINWKLLAAPSLSATFIADAENRMLSPSNGEAQSYLERGMKGEITEVTAVTRQQAREVAGDISLNQKALKVMRRVNDKLTGRDFDKDEVFDVDEQVDRLILEATSVENLSQCYLGWCPFW